MGNVIFCILHFLAFCFGFFGLFITVPLHLIYNSVNKKEVKTNRFIIAENPTNDKEIEANEN